MITTGSDCGAASWINTQKTLYLMEKIGENHEQMEKEELLSTKSCN